MGNNQTLVVSLKEAIHADKLNLIFCIFIVLGVIFRHTDHLQRVNESVVRFLAACFTTRDIH